jgi:hypothetical protein
LESFIFPLIILTVIIEQIGIRKFLPYPYRYGLLVFKTSTDVLSIAELRNIRSEKLGTKNSLFRLTSSLRFQDGPNPNGLYFFRSPIPSNPFYPSFYSGQVANDKNNIPTLYVRVGYFSALLALYAIFKVMISSHELAIVIISICIFMFLVANLYSLVKAFRRYVSLKS